MMGLKVAVAGLGRRLPALTVGSKCGWRRVVAGGCTDGIGWAHLPLGFFKPQAPVSAQRAAAVLVGDPVPLICSCCCAGCWPQSMWTAQVKCFTEGLHKHLGHVYLEPRIKSCDLHRTNWHFMFSFTGRDI